MRNYVENFLKYKMLLMELVIRDVKIKYRKSFLGMLWTLLNPLLMMTVITIVFSNIFKSDIKNFPVYFLSGQILFNFFAEATNSAMSSIIWGAPLLKKIYIPKYLFTVSKVFSTFVNLLFSLVALFIVIFVTGANIHFSVVLFILPLLYICIFTIGIGLILAAYAVFFRDLVHLYGVVLSALIYFTPIFYPPTIIPESYRFIVYFNPLYYYIQCFREIVLYGRIPSLWLNLVCISLGIVFLFIGLFIFYKKQDKFIMHL